MGEDFSFASTEQSIAAVFDPSYQIPPMRRGYLTKGVISGHSSSLSVVAVWCSGGHRCTQSLALCGPRERLPWITTACRAASGGTLQRGVQIGGRVDESDPFGERRGWDADGSVAFTKWDSVDTEALNDALASPDTVKRHFGPEWARMGTYFKHAVSVSSKGSGADAPAAAIGGHAASHDAVGLDGGAESDLLAALDSEERPHRDDIEESEVGGAPPEVPSAFTRTGAESTTPSGEGIANEDETFADAHSVPATSDNDATRPFLANDRSALSTEDPLRWTTEEVLAWLALYAPAVVDADAMEASECPVSRATCCSMR